VAVAMKKMASILKTGWKDEDSSRSPPLEFSGATGIGVYDKGHYTRDKVTLAKVVATWAQTLSRQFKTYYNKPCRPYPAEMPWNMISCT